MLAAVLCLTLLAPAALAEGEPAPANAAPTTIGGANTTLIPSEEENCLAWLFGDKITVPYLNVKGKGIDTEEGSPQGGNLSDRKSVV